VPVIVVTRLRLSDPALFDEFFVAAVAVTEQARKLRWQPGPLMFLADANKRVLEHAPPGSRAA